MPADTYRRTRFSLIRDNMKFGGILLGMYAIAFLLLLGMPRWSNVHRDTELGWWSRSKYCLVSMRTSMECYAQRTGEFPSTSTDLVRTACMDADIQFSISYNPDFSSIVFDRSKWDKFDQAYLWRANGPNVNDDSIIAIVIPDEHFAIIGVLRRDGRIEAIRLDAFRRDFAEWQQVVDGVKLGVESR